MKRHNDQRGTFIVFEGANGTGKSTAVRLVADDLRKIGVDVMETREPGGSPTAEKLRTIVLDEGNSMDPMEQAIVFNAARRNHLRTVVLPALELGKVVLCDRYVASTLVFQTLHQAEGETLNDNQVAQMHRQFCGGFAPDLQIVLDAPIDVIMGRRRRRDDRPDRFENGGEEYESAVLEKFRQSGEILGFNTELVDASLDQQEVVASILKHVQPLATDKVHSVLRYLTEPDRSGKWHPILSADGRVIWTSELHQAHALAAGHQARIMPRSLAIAALHANGLKTNEMETALRVWQCRADEIHR